jgi:transposase
MARPYLSDLRERVVATVERHRMSCREAAAQFGIRASTDTTTSRSHFLL